jgi:hypothetical protein
MLSATGSRALRSVLVLLAIAGPLAGQATGPGLATGGAASACATPAGITVPAPPADVAKIRAVEMPVLQQIDVPAAWRASRGKGGDRRRPGYRG